MGQGSFLKNRQRLETHRARERVRCVRVPMKELLQLFTVPQKRLVDLLRRERGCQRQIPARDSFREAHEVGLDPLLLTGEQRPCPTESRGDFIHDHMDVSLTAELDGTSEEPTRMHQHPCSSL